MTRGERKQLRVKPSYGFAHPDCRMAPPKGVDAAQAALFELQLLDWVPGDQVRGRDRMGRGHGQTVGEGGGGGCQGQLHLRGCFVRAGSAAALLGPCRQ
jgi:hypothetical protein